MSQADAVCFYLEPLPKVARYLRRYVSGSKCVGSGYGFCDAMVRIEDEPVSYSDGDGSRIIANDCTLPLGDSRWPGSCQCGYEFRPGDTWQLFINHIYSRSDNGQETTLRDAPVGAMWDAEWWPHKGPDGRHLAVKCPGGYDWQIDGQANNCTMKDDWQQERHHCWTRIGTPPLITVGKGYGPTCKAGAGSIATPNYHGFLCNGRFQQTWEPHKG